MLVQLHSRQLSPLGPSSASSFLARLTECADLPLLARAGEVLLVRRADGPLPPGFRGYLLHHPANEDTHCDVYRLAPEMRYLAQGDVVRIDPRRRSIATLYRRSSRSNSLLLTERCDNHCLMCSQPPRPDDDPRMLDEIKALIRLMSVDTAELGITGGEPGLLGAELCEIVRLLKHELPQTAVHMLSNGRRFSDAAFARALAKVAHPDLMVGIPVYSDLPEEHDYIVQARGAFSQTIRGILNLKQAGMRVELRFVLLGPSHARVREFTRFVARNLLFVDHVALMGLELKGFARSNLDTVWVDPVDYQGVLCEAVATLERAGVPLSIYNHQLCVLHPSLHRLARKSISDWKNTYFEECDGCDLRSHCGGFFASSTVRKSRGISRVIASG